MLIISDPGHYAKNRKKEVDAACAHESRTKTVPKKYKFVGERLKRWLLASINTARSDNT